MPDGTVRTHLAEHLRVAQDLEGLTPQIELVGTLIRSCLSAGGRVLTFGNGGSAADAQHLAAELVGRCRRERRALDALALTTDTSVMTAIGNDYGFSEIFARQIRAVAGRDDLVIGITTSGRSENVVRALAAARELGATTVALTGQNAGDIADNVVRVPSSTTARIQEMHGLIIHMLCELVDDWVGGDSGV